MRITPVAEIDELENQQEIILLRGKVVQMYDAHRGHDDETGNDWSFQRFTLKDDTGTRTVLLKNRDDLPKNYRGKEIIISAHKSDKGFSGIYAHDDTNKGKTTRIIKVTASAEIHPADEAPPVPQQAPPQPPPPTTTTTTTATTTAMVGGPPPTTTTDKVALQRRAVLDAKIKAARLANLFTIAVDVVEAVVAPHFEVDNGEPISAEQHQAAIGHIFGCLQRDGMADGLPVKPLADFMATADKDAEDAAARKRAAEEAAAKAEALRKEAEGYGLDDDEIPY